jgi:tRNA (guanine-N7-)-methyltransferase
MPMHSTLLATTKRRRSRITPRQAEALAAGSDRLLHLVSDPPGLSVDIGDLFPTGTPLILDIGFGTGEPVEILARQEPDSGVIAVDLHTPGIGDLLHRIESGGLDNVVVLEADIRVLLPLLPAQSLAGVRTFFPDPWPKKRHHRRRLVTSEFASNLAERVIPGGFWHLATDWPDYAEQIASVVPASGLWSGGVIARPEHRPITRYESYAQQSGRTAIDLWFERIPG